MRRRAHPSTALRILRLHPANNAGFRSGDAPLRSRYAVLAFRHGLNGYELLLLVGAVTTAVVLVGAISLAVVQFLPGDLPLPRSIPLIFLLLALVATAGPRFALRLSARARAPK